MNTQLLFIPLRKVDAAQRLVYGVATAEEMDKTNEICDYGESKPLIKAWSDSIREASAGKSLGNVRAMHNKTAAGILTQLEFNDDQKRVEVCAKITDDAEWAKVESGTYTGFSFGGSYAKRWQDPTNPMAKRYAAKPTELSLADNPCVPSATFTMVKADGVSEEKTFQPKPARELKPLKKGMWGVSSLARLIDDLKSIQLGAKWEAESEGDGSDMPAKLAAVIETLGTHLIEMAQEEVSELNESQKFAKAIDEAVEQLEKVGAKYSSETKDKIQKIHDHTTDMGAECATTQEKAMTKEEMQKIATGTGKTLEEVEAMLKAAPVPAPVVAPAADPNLAKALETIDALTKRLEIVEKQPAAAPAALPTVALSKTEDSAEKLAEIARIKLGGKKLEKTTDEAEGLALMKKAFANPFPVTEENMTKNMLFA